MNQIVRDYQIVISDRPEMRTGREGLLIFWIMTAVSNKVSDWEHTHTFAVSAAATQRP